MIAIRHAERRSWPKTGKSGGSPMMRCRAVETGYAIEHIGGEV
ncbi:hypothetical protein [Burkholderia ubonensis]|nr:hypothetical protein [Burkholderia ubonensis]